MSVIEADLLRRLTLGFNEFNFNTSEQNKEVKKRGTNKRQTITSQLSVISQLRSTERNGTRGTCTPGWEPLN